MTSQPWRNSRGWRARGYHVILRDGLVYLAKPTLGRVWSLPIDKGRWFSRQDWAESIPSPDLRRDLKRTIAACYCDPSTHCDFCTGLRQAPALEEV